jgi:hypothetical protein
MGARLNRGDEPVHELGAVTAITVKENDDRALRRKRLDARPARGSVSAFRFAHYSCPGGFRANRRGIGATVVHHDDLSGERAWNGRNHTGNRLLLVEGRDNDRDHADRATWCTMPFFFSVASAAEKYSFTSPWPRTQSK